MGKNWSLTGTHVCIHTFRITHIMYLKRVHLDISSRLWISTNLEMERSLLALMTQSHLFIQNLTPLPVIHHLSIRMLLTSHWSETDAMGELVPLDRDNCPSSTESELQPSEPPVYHEIPEQPSSRASSTLHDNIPSAGTK